MRVIMAVSVAIMVIGGNTVCGLGYMARKALTNARDILKIRIQTGRPLEEETLRKFRESVQVVMEEAQSVPVKAQRTYDEPIGMAPDTVNTYVLEGMEGMTPTEYQHALQRKVYDGLHKRRMNRQWGVHVSKGYIDDLEATNVTPPQEE